MRRVFTNIIDMIDYHCYNYGFVKIPITTINNYVAVPESTVCISEYLLMKYEVEKIGNSILIETRNHKNERLKNAGK